MNLKVNVAINNLKIITMNLINQIKNALEVGSFYSEQEIMKLNLEPQYKLGVKYYTRENASTIFYFERVNDEVSRLFYLFNKGASIYHRH